MSGGFNIDPEGLRRGADGISEVVDRLATSLQTLESKLSGFGSPWGTGLIGTVIGEIYNGIHEMAMGSFESNAEILSEYAEGLESMADDLEENEAEIENGMLDIRQQLEQTWPGSGGP